MKTYKILYKLNFSFKFYNTPDSNIENLTLLQSISANAPYGIIIIGSVCPKFILYIIGKSLNPNSSIITFLITSKIFK